MNFYMQAYKRDKPKRKVDTAANNNNNNNNNNNEVTHINGDVKSDKNVHIKNANVNGYILNGDLNGHITNGDLRNGDLSRYMINGHNGYIKHEISGLNGFTKTNSHLQNGHANGHMTQNGTNKEKMQ